MALIQCHFTSINLRVQTTIFVVIPTITYSEVNEGQKDMYEPGTKFQTLYLLHGYSQDQSCWTRYSNIERYATENRLAVVMPGVEHSFYTDMAHGNRYWTYVCEELPRVARALFPLSDKREDNFVTGLSMGGYGAFKVALRNPDKFAAAASLSGVLDIANLVESSESKNMITSELTDVFGNLSMVKGSDNDLFNLAAKLSGDNTEKPKLFQCCGTEDFLYQDNIRFRDHAVNLGLDMTYIEGKGIHDWNFWDEYIKKVIEWLPLKKQPILV